MPASQPTSQRAWVMSAVDTYERRLVRFAARLLGDEEAARDVVQHAFLQLCRQRPEKIDERLGPWLFTAVRNRAFDLLRQRRQQPLGDGAQLDDMPGDDCDPACVLESRELGDLLLALVEKLPDAQRETVLLWLEGHSGVEIANITGCEKSTTRVHLHKAFKTLREHPAVRKIEMLEERIVRN